MALLRGAFARAELLGYAAAGAVAAGTAIELAYRTQPLVPLAGAAAVAATALALARPVWGVYVAIGLIPLEVFPLPIGTVATLSPAEAAFVLAGVAWALRRLASGELPYTPSPLGKPLALLLIAIVPGLAVAPDPLPVIKVLVMWSSFFLLYQLLISEATLGEVRGLLIAIALSATVIGAVTVIGVNPGEQQLVNEGTEATGRAVGTFEHPNILATFLGIGLVASLAMALRGPAVMRPAMLGGFVLTTFGLVLTLSRGGFLAVAGALMVLLAWRSFRRLALIGLVTIAVLFAVDENPLGDVQETDLFTQRVSSVSEAAGTDPRLEIWQTTPQIIADHPLVGIGASSFVEVAPRYGLIDPSTFDPYEHAHNIALTVTAELGILGLAGLAWLALAVAVVAWQALRRAATEAERAVAFALVAGVVGVAVQGTVDYTVGSNVLGAVVMCLLAGIVALATRPAAIPAPPARDSAAASPPPS
jgi:O-antigen ligase